jgi:hypothetical protein
MMGGASRIALLIARIHTFAPNDVEGIPIVARSAGRVYRSDLVHGGITESAQCAELLGIYLAFSVGEPVSVFSIP